MAVAFDPGQINAYYQLSLLARKQGDRKRAVELAEIYQRLTREADARFQENFTDMVEESLSGGHGPAVRPAE